jgi:hypothetical protein
VSPGSDGFDPDGTATWAKEMLGPEAFMATWEAGRALTVEQAVAKALAVADESG